MGLGIIREKDSVMEEIANIKKVVVKCLHCESEVRFDVGSSIKMRPLYSCPMCGTLYGIDAEDDVITRTQQLISSVKSVNGARFSFLCEAES